MPWKMADMYGGLGARREERKKKKEREPEPPPEAVPAGRAPYTVLITPEAQKSLDAVPGNVRKAMLDKMEQLKGYPEVSGIKRMFGEAFGKQRLKFWDWRMEFSVDEKTRTVLVEKIGHREEVYWEYHH